MGDPLAPPLWLQRLARWVGGAGSILWLALLPATIWFAFHPPHTPALVARRDIPAYTRITAADVWQRPVVLRPPHGLVDARATVGRITRVAIPRRQVLKDDMLLERIDLQEHPPAPASGPEPPRKGSPRATVVPPVPLRQRRQLSRPRPRGTHPRRRPPGPRRPATIRPPTRTMSAAPDWRLLSVPLASLPPPRPVERVALLGIAKEGSARVVLSEQAYVLGVSKDHVVLALPRADAEHAASYTVAPRQLLFLRRLEVGETPASQATPLPRGNGSRRTASRPQRNWSASVKEKPDGGLAPAAAATRRGRLRRQ